ncbi:CarD family transcriptional regulator [Lentibacillus salicampi]|uniref:CarD family transcriptional regulator n=1 Tax=Lentibacillus salicampi TaxID=175306 RepID=A0A4Y9A6G4_9BACI|nr:CarD family transcriptional regulator [Lentibacillus salicampi]TFJ91213.1 CarD family transcriptional regulator [Lentibacillus salicampi]
MFNVGDLMIYSTHGLCRIDDICEKSYGKVARTYYVMHPIEEPELTINAPVDGDPSMMQTIMEKDEAERVIQSFQNPGIQWIDNARQRNKKYNNLVNTGDRQEISMVANTLMRKELEVDQDKSRVYDQDRKLLAYIQGIMFRELAVSLDTTFENISEKINTMIRQSA